MLEIAFRLLHLQAIPTILFIASVIGSFFVYERLVKRQYEIARYAWEADDRPPGFAWAPPGTSVMRSWTRGKAMWCWTWLTPPWIRADPSARALQGYLRALSAAALLGWLWLLAIVGG
jgi:hypothetical protein